MPGLVHIYNLTTHYYCNNALTYFGNSDDSCIQAVDYYWHLALYHLWLLSPIGMTAEASSPKYTIADPCYFTINPPTYDHYTVETPLATPLQSPGVYTPADPYNPLLAYRAPQTPSMASANLLKLQTAAAHGHPSRPRPQPQQNVLHVTSDDSSSSSSSSSSSDSDSDYWSPPETARCSRCQRTPSIDIHTGRSNMIPYGLNLFYCSRCAGMVGMVNR